VTQPQPTLVESYADGLYNGADFLFPENGTPRLSSRDRLAVAIARRVAADTAALITAREQAWEDHPAVDLDHEESR